MAFAAGAGASDVMAEAATAGTLAKSKDRQIQRMKRGLRAEGGRMASRAQLSNFFASSTVGTLPESFTLPSTTRAGVDITPKLMMRWILGDLLHLVGSSECLGGFFSNGGEFLTFGTTRAENLDFFHKD